VLRRLVAVIALVCLGGCSSTATIVRTDGPDNEAEIANSDAAALYVRARNGQIYRINRESIADIDHPGNVEIIVGSLLLGLGSDTGLALHPLPDLALLVLDARLDAAVLPDRGSSR
jgi:hypothetical protein